MALARNALTPFLLISLAFHLLFLGRWPARGPRESVPEEIPVTVLPAPLIEESPPLPTPEKPPEKPAASRPEKAEPAVQPAKSAKRSGKGAASTEAPRSQPSAPVAAAERPSQVEVARARLIEREPDPARPLPKLKDLVPSAVGLAVGDMSGRLEAPIPLNSKDPRYVPYLTIVKQTLDAVWKYPPEALQYGLEGTVRLEFAILNDGKLGGARILRSSGYVVLDKEVIRALTVASPFPPIPPRMGKSRMDLTATFEYTDSRLKYAPTP